MEQTTPTSPETEIDSTLSDENQEENQEEKKKGRGKGYRYFRTNIAALSVVVGKPKGDNLAPETVRFSPVSYVDSFGNHDVKGFLKTNNPVAIEKLLNDSYVEEIEASVYNDVMKQAADESNPKVKFGR